MSAVYKKHFNNYKKEFYERKALELEDNFISKKRYAEELQLKIRDISTRKAIKCCGLPMSIIQNIADKDHNITDVAGKNEFNSVTFSQFDGVTCANGIYHCGKRFGCIKCANMAMQKEIRTINIARDLMVEDHSNLQVAFLTLTGVHKIQDELKDLRQNFTKIFHKCFSGRNLQKLKDNFNFLGYLRVLEVTEGKNGFHPHIHAIIFFTEQNTQEKLNMFFDVIFNKWSNFLVKANYEKPLKKYSSLELEKDKNCMIKYFMNSCFMSLSSELFGGAAKQSKNGNRNITQIYYDAAMGDKDSIKKIEIIENDLLNSKIRTMSDSILYYWRKAAQLMEEIEEEFLKIVEKNKKEVYKCPLYIYNTARKKAILYKLYFVVSCKNQGLDFLIMFEKDIYDLSIKMENEYNATIPFDYDYRTAVENAINIAYNLDLSFNKAIPY